MTQLYTRVVLLAEVAKFDFIFVVLLVEPYDILVSDMLPVMEDVPEMQLKGLIVSVNAPTLATKNTAYGWTVGGSCDVVICDAVENTNVGRPLMLSVPTVIAVAVVPVPVGIAVPLFTIVTIAVPLVVYDVGSAASIHTQGLIPVGRATGTLLHVYGTIAAVVAGRLGPVTFLATTSNV